MGTAVVLGAGIVTGCAGTAGTGSTVSQAAAQGSDIGQEKAKEIAFVDAGVNEADAQRVKVSKDMDDGITKYEVDFDAGQTEYSYDIAASDGKILSYDTEVRDDLAVQSQQSDDSQTGSVSQTGVKISEEEAKKTALGKVKGATEQDLRMKLDLDDGRYTYEGDIIYDRQEYEFEIDAQTGSILKWEVERY